MKQHDRPRLAPHGTPFAKKRFGQHFLHDTAVVARIVRAIAPQPGDRLVEIGPGHGALTGPLLERIPTMTAIEIDRDVIPGLQERFGERLQLVQADALEVNYRALAAGGRLRLVGNLPYNISSPLLFHLLGQADAIQDMHFMLQKEVVDRMTAAPDTPEYGRLTVALAARADVADLFGVGPGAFRPPPRVDSAVVRIVPRPPPFAIADLAEFDRVVKQAFAQRRKTLANTLKGLRSREQLLACGIDPGVRAETLTPAEFAALANLGG